MFEKLRKKWKVGAWQLLVILTCFAVAGSLTGFAGRKLMNGLPIEQPVLWWIIYIIVVSFLWPIFVIVVALVFGQYRFFKNYLGNMAARMRGTSKAKAMNNRKEVRIAIFASGTGTNAARIIEHFNHPGEGKEEKAGKVCLVVCNKPGAGVLQIAEKNRVPVLMIEKDPFFRGNAYVDELKEADIDFIVLAGFLWKIPGKLIAAYPGKIINIHPALLPKYGGKGMYGQKVHEAVIANKETETGISIHWVDEQYDNGANIFQARCPVLPGDTPETLAARIHQLEHRHFPEVIESLL
jgi:formyltetrahydrofolate-dependent phosphoribosylglycinamide formyltransferase